MDTYEKQGGGGVLLLTGLGQADGPRSDASCDFVPMKSCQDAGDNLVSLVDGYDIRVVQLH